MANLDLENVEKGFKFLAITTGIGLVIMFIISCAAIEDRVDYATSTVIITIILAFMFLISGFFAYAT
jgi:hypothetical protein